MSAVSTQDRILPAGTDLVVVGRAGIGLDNVDVAAATERGVMVVNAPQSNILSAAEQAMALLLAQARNIPQAHAALVAGKWERSKWEGVELHGKTLGVVGLGRVGALVANPPVVDMGRYMEAWVGSEVYRMARDIRPEDVTGVPEDLMPRQMQWGIEAICTRFGVPSFHAWRDAMSSYRLGDLVGAVSCPVLALVGGREGVEPRAQFDALVSGVTGPVRSRVFQPSDGTSAHCQSDNLRLSAQVTFDWLEDELGASPTG